jgi:GTP-binding protein
VHLVDVRRDPTKDDLQMLDFLSGIGIPTLVAITKVDKLTHERRGKVLPVLTEALALDPGQVVPFSAKTGEGKDDLLEAIERIVEGAGEGSQVGDDRG